MFCLCNMLHNTSATNCGCCVHVRWQTVEIYRLYYCIHKLTTLYQGRAGSWLNTLPHVCSELTDSFFCDTAHVHEITQQLFHKLTIYCLQLLLCVIKSNEAVNTENISSSQVTMYYSSFLQIWHSLHKPFIINSVTLTLCSSDKHQHVEVWDIGKKMTTKIFHSFNRYSSCSNFAFTKTNFNSHTKYCWCMQLRNKIL